MARRPRLQFPGALYHVMSRGNRKSCIFDTDVDRDRFMRLLADTALAYDARVYAACAMGTHYHLLLDTPRGNLSAMMRQLNAVFSQDSNRLYRRTGHTFEARFHSIVVQRERYLRRVARYVVLNPVKAGLCGDPASCQWTTYRRRPDWSPRRAGSTWTGSTGHSGRRHARRHKSGIGHTSTDPLRSSRSARTSTCSARGAITERS
jgi:putative transposase